MNIEKILKELEKLDIQVTFDDITEYLEGRHSIAFIIFNGNLLRALILLAQEDPINYCITRSNKTFIYPSNPKFENTIILLITALEIYLRRLFKTILFAKLEKDRTILNRISDYFNITEVDFKEIISNKIIELIMPSLFKKLKLNFQNNEDIKKAFKFLEIDLVNIINHQDNDLWRRIFSDEKKNLKKRGYFKIRHKLVHGGIESSILLKRIITIDLIERAILDITKFVFIIESDISSKYPKEQYVNIYFK